MFKNALSSCFKTSGSSSISGRILFSTSQPVNIWKENVVVQPIQTTVEDLKRTHRKCNDGIYISHRSYLEKLPETYTIEPILTRRTGGYDIETS